MMDFAVKTHLGAFQWNMLVTSWKIVQMVQMKANNIATVGPEINI